MKYSKRAIPLEAIRNIKLKQTNIQKFTGLKIPQTKLWVEMSKQPLFLSDDQLKEMSKWKRYQKY